MLCLYVAVDSSTKTQFAAYVAASDAHLMCKEIKMYKALQRVVPEPANVFLVVVVVTAEGWRWQCCKQLVIISEFFPCQPAYMHATDVVVGMGGDSLA